MKEYKKFDDKLLAKKLKKPISKIQEKMYYLSRNQKKRNWVIIFLNKQYIYYNENIVKNFKVLYNKGLGEKELLEKLKKIEVNTRAEVKAIEDTLIRSDRLSKREISVKEYREKKRFS